MMHANHHACATAADGSAGAAPPANGPEILTPFNSREAG
jgi:hypothetical protein